MFVKHCGLSLFHYALFATFAPAFMEGQPRTLKDSVKIAAAFELDSAVCESLFTGRRRVCSLPGALSQALSDGDVSE